MKRGRINFPNRAILDDNGKPLLSWRVLPTTLMDLDAGYLVDKFHYDEPWDSPHNIKLLDQMPPILKSPNSKSKDPTKTNYVLAVGKGTSFPDFGSSPTTILVINDRRFGRGGRLTRRTLDKTG